MHYFKKIFGSSLLSLGLLATFSNAEIVYKYMPLATDEGMTVVIPYDSVNIYTPPADTIAHTFVETTEGKKMRIDRIKYGFVIEGHENQFVILEVFGNTCPHCLASIPELNKLKAKYGDKLYILSLEDYGLSNAALKAYKTSKGITYDLVAGEKAGTLRKMIVDLDGAIPGVPWTLLLAPNGNQIINPHLGDVSFDQFDAEIQNYMSQNP